MTVALRTEGLTRRFGGIVAVADVSLELKMHQLHAVIGPNGAGKSTLVNLLFGDLPPTEGSIRLDGTDITRRPDWWRARAGIGRTFQRTNVMREMTVLENVRLAAQAMCVRARGLLRTPRQAPEVDEAARDALCRVGLERDAERVAGTMSHGALRLLEIAIALAPRPRVLLLDEPLAGLGTEETAPVADLFRQLGRTHAVLLIEHDMNVVFSVADTITVMVEGRVLTAGTPAEIRASQAVQDAYLGRPAD
ncbi:MAG: ABC transporter ATP-binding protein [Acetobacteraceae bacterium]